MSNTPEENKALVREVFEKVINGGDADLAAKYYTVDYVQHNPNVAQGLEGLQALLRAMHSSPSPMQAEIVLMNAEDDMVWLLVNWTGGEQRDDRPRLGASAEVFRVEDGMLAEHWDVVQMEPPRKRS